jgi:hypothetical protein
VTARHMPSPARFKGAATIIDVVGEIEHDTFGVMPNAATASLGSMVLTRSARRGSAASGAGRASVEEMAGIGG